MPRIANARFGPNPSLAVDRPQAAAAGVTSLASNGHTTGEENRAYTTVTFRYSTKPACRGGRCALRWSDTVRHRTALPTPINWLSVWTKFVSQDHTMPRTIPPSRFGLLGVRQESERSAYALTSTRAARYAMIPHRDDMTCHLSGTEADRRRTTMRGAEHHDLHQLYAHLACRVFRRKGEAPSRASVSLVYHEGSAMQGPGSSCEILTACGGSCCQLASRAH